MRTRVNMLHVVVKTFFHNSEYIPLRNAFIQSYVRLPEIKSCPLLHPCGPALSIRVVDGRNRYQYLAVDNKIYKIGFIFYSLGSLDVFHFENLSSSCWVLKWRWWS